MVSRRIDSAQSKLWPVERQISWPGHWLRSSGLLNTDRSTLTKKGNTSIVTVSRFFRLSLGNERTNAIPSRCVIQTLQHVSLGGWLASCSTAQCPRYASIGQWTVVPSALGHRWRHKMEEPTARRLFFYWTEPLQGSRRNLYSYRQFLYCCRRLAAKKRKF